MSEQDRAAFEGAYLNQAGVHSTHDLRTINNQYVDNHARLAYQLWNAATAKANEWIEALESEVAELKEQLSILKPHPLCNTSCLLSCSMEADYAEKQYLENQQLQANNHDLREALKYTLYSLEGRGIPAGVDPANLTVQYHKCKNILQQALSATPAESLQAHDDDVIASITQSLTDPENQPSQFGTVPLEWYENLENKLEKVRFNVSEVIDSLDGSYEKHAIRKKLQKAIRALKGQDSTRVASLCPPPTPGSKPSDS